MELAFDSRALRTMCESETVAKRNLGPKVAEILKHRLGELQTEADVLRDYAVAGRR